MLIVRLLSVLLICVNLVFADSVYKKIKIVKDFDPYKNPHFNGDRTTIVQLFEWRWIDVASECERFLGPNGFGGVEVSPVTEHLIMPSIDRPWWERYQPLSYILTTRSGNEKDFARMVQRCNDVGVRIYVDVILNHMTGNYSQSVGTGGSTANYTILHYPFVPYERPDFNEPCDITNYNDPVMVRNCELNGYRDLNQNLPYVQFKIVNFLNTLIDLGVAGFKIHAAKYMWPDDLANIYERLRDLRISAGFEENSRPFIYQEIADFGLEAISKDEYIPLAAVTEFKAGITLSTIFRKLSPLSELENWGENIEFVESESSLVFMENHENQREQEDTNSVLTYKDPKIYKASITFLLAHPYGNVKLMSSYYFNDPNEGPPTNGYGEISSPLVDSNTECENKWVCEHKWGPIYRMVKFRNRVKGSNLIIHASGRYHFILERERVGLYIVNINTDVNQDLPDPIRTNLPDGRYCDVISGERSFDSCTGKILTVVNGDVKVEILPSDIEYSIAIHTGIESLLPN